MRNMKGLSNILFFLIAVIFISCDIASGKKEAVDKVAEISFRYYNLENQGWKSKNYTQIVDDISFTATEVPLQYYLLKSNGKDALITVDSLYEKNKTERIFEFVFQEENEKDLLAEEFTGLDYKSSVTYMSFKVQKDFYVVTTFNDTIPCSGVLFEQSHKIVPYNKLMLFFSGINPEDKVQLVYQDNLFKKGILKFRFKDPILHL